MKNQIRDLFWNICHLFWIDIIADLKKILKKKTLCSSLINVINADFFIKKNLESITIIHKQLVYEYHKTLIIKTEDTLLQQNILFSLFFRVEYKYSISQTMNFLFIWLRKPDAWVFYERKKFNSRM